MTQYIKDKVIEYIKKRLIPTVNHGNTDDWERGTDNERINFLSYINSISEEHVSEDLEKVADGFYDNCNITKSSWWDEGVLHKMSESKETFIAGAEWQKQQMMKDAVDATIFSELKGSDCSLFQAKSDRFKMNGVKISDRIKVIPIKTEQQ